LKHIALVIKNDDNAMRMAAQLATWLTDKGVTVITRCNWPCGSEALKPNQENAPPFLSCVIVLGGDGTFLSAVRWIGNQAIPVLGVKFGELGFLAETAEESLFDVAEDILCHNFTTRTRMRLDVGLKRHDKEIVHETVLNDVVINKGTLARLASIRTLLDGCYLTTYKADGLIISTPTGSTAYSLAAGGPILHPDVPGIIMTPICPFTLTIRPLIIPDTLTIEIALERKSRNIMVTFDGQAGMEMDEADTLIIRKSLFPVHMINIPGQNYFDIVKAKLRWSGGRV
jgi:NAD+ kinase